ncbi:Uncharacterized protein Adt_06505 [Abeliophyllum distichum]|uniref:Uncharacterized protein n=1 Tax=Abeliophyllum distichum TaxID=126358 RepID=A0ABD1V747_9LAMI
MLLCAWPFRQHLGGRQEIGWQPFLQNPSTRLMIFLKNLMWAKKTDIGLIQLTHDKDERMKYFIARFNRATLRIKDLHMSTVVTTMMSGTRSRPFKMSLCKNPSDTMHELLRRGDKYVDAEEAYFITKGMKDRKKP